MPLLSCSSPSDPANEPPRECGASTQPCSFSERLTELTVVQGAHQGEVQRPGSLGNGTTWHRTRCYRSNNRTKYATNLGSLAVVGGFGGSGHWPSEPKEALSIQ